METLTKNQTEQDRKIRSTLDKVYNLPALPDIVTEALRLLNSKEASNKQLMDIIAKEQSFVAKVLALANSPIYGLRKEVSTLDFAIMVLGYNELKHIVFVISFLESFRGTSSKHFDQNLYWMHSLLTAKVSKTLAEDFGYPKSGEAFVGGFLHDIGVSIMQRYFKNNFLEIKDLSAKNDISYLEAENNILGMNHTEMGNYLLSKWNLPQALRRSTLYHHSPIEDKEDPMLAAIVHLADYVTRKVYSENLFWEKGADLNEQALSILGVKEEKYEEFMDKYTSVIGSDQEVMGILS